MAMQRQTGPAASWTRRARSIFKQYVMPAEHGGWFLWIGPFLLGTFAADRFSGDIVVLLLLIVSGFLARQPLVILVKSMAGRRAQDDILPASKVFAVLALFVAVFLAILLAHGHWYLIWLALPAVPVLAVQMWLVARRQERQIAIELFGAGVLALAATAAYWVSLGSSDIVGWLLWALAWLYNASAIVYVYLRLQQRRWSAVPEWRDRLRAGRRTLIYAGVNLAVSLVLSLLGFVSPVVPLAFAFAVIHFGWGIAFPAVRARPTRVGIEQSIATVAFFLILAIAFRV